MCATIFLERRFLMWDTASIDEVVSDCLHLIGRNKFWVGRIHECEFLPWPDHVKSVFDRKRVRMNVYNRVAGAVGVYEQFAHAEKRSLRFARKGGIAGNWSDI